MQSYQEEYLANLERITLLASQQRAEEATLEEFSARLEQGEREKLEIVRRNMVLLREELFPALDRAHSMDETELKELSEFADRLLPHPSGDPDPTLFCQIHQTLLSLARYQKDRDGIIRELYWMGIGRHAIANRLVGLDHAVMEPYTQQMRAPFTEAASYLDEFAEISSSETRGYILRALANTSLGQFPTVSERVHRIKTALQVMQNPQYHRIAPDLPWERYLQQTHRLMTTSISYSKETAMSPEDVAAIMESVYIVYHEHDQAVRNQEERRDLRHIFHYDAIEYYCGMDSLNGLLAKMEQLMNTAMPGDYSTEGMYASISLPAFYSQYLGHYPELIEGREPYIDGLYSRILRYMDDFPPEEQSESLFVYLRQLSYTFVETPDGVLFGEFLHKVLSRFAPDIYLHSQMVGYGTAALCGQIFDRDPGFFDDIPSVAAAGSLETKRQELTRFALECGMLHDVGKINFIGLYIGMGRQWFDEEYQMSRLHPVTGGKLLAARPSTKSYADAALGHHAWYDGRSESYPPSYNRQECPIRRLVDVLSLVNWLENITRSIQAFNGTHMTFDDAAAKALSLSGTRFSPRVAGCLRDEATLSLLKEAFRQGKKAAYEEHYRWSKQKK